MFNLEQFAKDVSNWVNLSTEDKDAYIEKIKKIREEYERQNNQLCEDNRKCDRIEKEKKRRDQMEKNHEKLLARIDFIEEKSEVLRIDTKVKNEREELAKYTDEQELEDNRFLFENKDKIDSKYLMSDIYDYFDTFLDQVCKKLKDPDYDPNDEKKSETRSEPDYNPEVYPDFYPDSDPDSDPDDNPDFFGNDNRIQISSNNEEWNPIKNGYFNDQLYEEIKKQEQIAMDEMENDSSDEELLTNHYEENKEVQNLFDDDIDSELIDPYNTPEQQEMRNIIDQIEYKEIVFDPEEIEKEAAMLLYKNGDSVGAATYMLLRQKEKVIENLNPRCDRYKAAKDRAIEEEMERLLEQRFTRREIVLSGALGL